jgi:hypothetical protein
MVKRRDLLWGIHCYLFAFGQRGKQSPPPSPAVDMIETKDNWGDAGGVPAADFEEWVTDELQSGGPFVDSDKQVDETGKTAVGSHLPEEKAQMEFVVVVVAAVALHRTSEVWDSVVVAADVADIS